jgi:hypothetical protein
MKRQSLATLFVAVGLSAASAGPATPSPTVAIGDLPPVCDCFDLGGSGIDLFGIYIEPDGNGLLEDGFGGGVGFTHFRNSYLGFSTGVYWWDEGEEVSTSVSGSIILRYPVRSLCIAPYGIGGVTGHLDSLNQFSWHLGGGVEFRIPAFDAVGFFVDATYNWADDTEDFGIFRVGTRYNF